MSTILGNVVNFTIEKHPNADALSVAKICDTEWQLIVKTSDWIPADKSYNPEEIYTGVYFGVDVLVDPTIPQFSFLLDKATKKFSDGRKGHRIKTIRLRGCLSQGLIIKNEWPGLTNEEIQVLLKVERYEPPIDPSLGGEMDREPGSFIRYTDIENAKNHPNSFREEYSVRVTEKLHGTNARFGLAFDGKDISDYKVGSHNKAKQPDGTTLYAEMGRIYFPEDKMREFIAKEGISFTEHFIIFGEIFGNKVQDLNYGCETNVRKVRIFDVCVDHKYQSKEIIEKVSEFFGVEIVPVLYRGPFSKEIVMGLRDGKSTLPGATHCREGVVVTIEPETRIGQHRGILKFISDEYLLRKGEKDGH